MPTLYLNRRATSVSREGEHLLVKQHDLPNSPQQVVPLHDLTSVVVVGEPSITFPALSCFIQRQIPVSFLSVGGAWRGCIDTSADAYGERRAKQYRKSLEVDFALPMAKSLIAAKLYNSLRLLQRLEAGRTLSPIVSDEDLHHKHQLKWIYNHLQSSGSANALRGLEGIGAVHYFSLLRHFFPVDVPFEKRQRHPAKDPANALLSWAYALLLSEIVSLLRQHYLDPAMGVLHVNANRAPSLALDLMEPFRPAFADRLVLNLLNRRVIQANKHFVTTDKGAVLLNEVGRTVFFSAYENALTRPFVNPQTEQNTTLREVLHQHVVSYLRYLEAPEGMPIQPPMCFHLP